MTDATIDTSAPLVSPPRLTVFDTGSETCPQGQLPGAAVFTVDEEKNALNPVQYVPVVGMIYRQATGETIPPPLSILGSVASGAVLGPIGILGSVLFNFVQEMFRVGPDTSRPAAPLGMEAAGKEAGMHILGPGEKAPTNSYTTLATSLPDFLGGGTEFAGTDQSPGQVRVALEAYSGTMTGPGNG